MNIYKKFENFREKKEQENNATSVIITVKRMIYKKKTTSRSFTILHIRSDILFGVKCVVKFSLARFCSDDLKG